MRGVMMELTGPLRVNPQAQEIQANALRDGLMEIHEQRTAFAKAKRCQFKPLPNMVVQKAHATAPYAVLLSVLVSFVCLCICERDGFVCYCSFYDHPKCYISFHSLVLYHGHGRLINI